MVNVVVAGLPKGAKLSKVMKFIKRAVLRCNKEVHVNYFKQTSDSFRQLSFSTKFNQALKAKNFLDGYSYIYANLEYPLECWLENLDEDEIEFQPALRLQQREEDVEENYEPPPKSFRYSSPVRSKSPSRSTAKSRSPHHSSELEAIELKIELIKKQRILMEEETKLLLEKRKLEYLKNSGSNNFGKLAKFEEVSRRNDPNEISDFLASAEPSKLKSDVKPNKLPMFTGPVKEINAQMKPLVRGHSGINSENATLFWNLLRSTLKKRLIIILEGKKYMPTKAIVGLYRAEHPQSTDQSLIDGLLNTINTSCWPSRNNVAQTASDIAESQTTEAENPPADAVEETDLTETTEHATSADANQCVDLDDFVGDVENDFENWDDDEETSNVQDNVGESINNEEQITAADDVNKTNMAEKAATTDPTFEDVDEAVLIVDDADKFRDAENAVGEGDKGKEERVEQ